jgi:hypothetical protein
MLKTKITKEEIIYACTNSITMREAASKLAMHYNTFSKYAKLYGCYKPNKSGKGTNKNRPSIPIDEILNGEHPSYHTYKLKLRLYRELHWTKVCSNCKLSEWLGNEIPLELDHEDGNPYNHKVNNLRLLCPNCHTLTSTYRAKNKRS